MELDKDPKLEPVSFETNNDESIPQPSQPTKEQEPIQAYTNGERAYISINGNIFEMCSSVIPADILMGHVYGCYKDFTSVKEPKKAPVGVM